MENHERHIVGGTVIGLTADSLKEDRKEAPKAEEQKPVKKRATVKK